MDVLCHVSSLCILSVVMGTGYFPNDAICCHRGFVKNYLLSIRGYFYSLFMKKICCGFMLEAPRRGASNKYPQHML